MSSFQLLLLSAFLISSFSRCLTEENTTLLLVQALFRHADRAPTFLYPTDPNGEENWPMGLGKLTEIGKKQHYEVGRFLRSMYKDFVTSNPREVYVNSSAIDRCLVSAAANLASFYAPEERWKFEGDLNWQPIPIHYLPKDLDKYLNFERSCPRSDTESIRQLKSKELQELYETHEDLVKDVSYFSGLNYTEDGIAFFLFDVLEIEKFYNLTIPEWANYYWSDMRYIANLVFKVFYSSPIQLRMRAGPFLQTIAENMKNKIDKNSPHLKVVVSSTHDVNVAVVLQALNFTNMPRPPYCATLLFELHEMADKSMAVRLLYLNSTTPLGHVGEPHVLFLDNCSEFCPMEHFTESFQWLIPGNWEEECQMDESYIEENWKDYL